MRKSVWLLPIAGLMLATPALAQSSDNVKKARANFIAADKNKDGKLNKAEFRSLINANAKAGVGKANMVKRFGAYDCVFNRLDANKDGFVTGAEIRAARKQER